MSQDNFDGSLVDADIHSAKILKKPCFAFALCKFITEVIKVNGKRHPPNTLKEMVYCRQMFLHTKCIFWFILDRSDEVFLDVYYVLDNEMKRCTNEGLGYVKSCTPVSISIEDKIWESGHPGEDNGTEYGNVSPWCKFLGLRGGNKHKSLQRPGLICKLRWKRILMDSSVFNTLRIQAEKCIRVGSVCIGGSRGGILSAHPL